MVEIHGEGVADHAGDAVVDQREDVGVVARGAGAVAQREAHGDAVDQREDHDAAVEGRGVGHGDWGRGPI